MKAEGKKEKKDVADLRTPTKELALRITRRHLSLPKRTNAQVIGKQFIRSEMSVGASGRQVYRVRSKAELNAKVGNCRKKIEETGYWLELLVDSGIVYRSQLAGVRNEGGEPTAIYITSIRKAKSNNRCGALK